MTVSTIYKLAAEMSTKGNLPSGVAAANKQLKAMQSSIGGINSSVANLGRSIGSGAFQTAGAITKGAGAAGAAAAGVAAGMMAKSGLAANANLERMTNTVAGTLTLFNRNVDATDQISANVKDATAALKELNKIADESPGSTAEIQGMFTRMLPGANAVTQDMNRILKLTQSVAVLTPTFGTDFNTSGSQTGRILTGSAGAEMEVFQKLRKLIHEAGVEMESVGGGKIFKKELNPFSDKFTQQFNQLNGLDRLALLESVMGKAGGPLAALYKSSWDGASASAVSSVSKVKAAFTGPIFKKIKDSLTIHTSKDNSLLGSNRTAKMVVIAEQIGSLMAKPVENMLERVSQAFRYVQENTRSVVNRIYQGFQIAGAIIRGAAAYMLTRMMIGAGLMAAAAAGRAVGGAARGARGAFDATRGAGRGIASAASATARFFKSFTAGGAASNALGVFTMLGSAFGKMAMFAAVLVPMAILAAAAFALLAIPLLAAAGIAAYVASKWRELSASVVKGLQDGTITLRPLIIAALVFWERLKKIGEAFLGGKTGASMMQRAIEMATSVVNGLSEGVAIMATIAAGMLTIVGKLAQAYDAVFGESDTEKQIKRTKELMDQGAGFDEAQKRAAAEQANGFNTRQAGFGDDAIALAEKLTAAAKTWRSVDIKSIDEGMIASWTNALTTSVLDFFGPPKEDPKVPKGPRVSVQNLYQNIDMRGEDPDRALSALITPIENLARRPTASGSDTVGGMG